MSDGGVCHQIGIEIPPQGPVGPETLYGGGPVLCEQKRAIHSELGSDLCEQTRPVHSELGSVLCEQKRPVHSELGSRQNVDISTSKMDLDSKQVGREIPHGSSENDVPDDRPSSKIVSSLEGEYLISKTYEKNKDGGDEQLTPVMEAMLHRACSSWLQDKDSSLPSNCDSNSFNHPNVATNVGSDLLMQSNNFTTWTSNQADGILIPPTNLSSIANTWDYDASHHSSSFKKLLSPSKDGTSYLWDVNSTSHPPCVSIMTKETDVAPWINTPTCGADVHSVARDAPNEMDTIAQALHNVRFDAPGEEECLTSVVTPNDPFYGDSLPCIALDDAVETLPADDVSLWKNFDETPIIKRQRSTSADKAAMEKEM